MASVLLHITVPYVNQLDPVPNVSANVLRYACGPACAAMVAAWKTRRPPPFAQAIALLGGKALVGVGTDPWPLARAIRALAPGAQSDTTHAADAATAHSLLRLELRQGRPLIALVRPSWVVTGLDHYVVVSGLDDPNTVRVNDPLVGSDVGLNMTTFLTAWQHSRFTRPYTYVWVR